MEILDKIKDIAKFVWKDKIQRIMVAGVILMAIGCFISGLNIVWVIGAILCYSGISANIADIESTKRDTEITALLGRVVNTTSSALDNHKEGIENLQEEVEKLKKENEILRGKSGS